MLFHYFEESFLEDNGLSHSKGITYAQGPECRLYGALITLKFGGHIDAKKYTAYIS
jgi:hypothetical protein